jgi:C1A family cysteine protease
MKNNKNPVDPTKGKPIGGHAMELVGYGYSGSRLYWIFKNSWGADFGDKGYVSIFDNENMD